MLDVLLDTGAILAITECDKAHETDKKAAEKGVLFMAVTGTFRKYILMSY